LKLFYRKYGEQGPSLVILHGLYGASDNWASLARVLSAHFQVYTIDQRNHGQSPHADDMDYKEMRQDLYSFFKTNGLTQAHIIGHSMGGKTAMHFALHHPHLVNKLVVVDIAPKSYASFSNYAQITNDHRQIIDTLKSVNLVDVRNRKEIDQQLTNAIPDASLRHFLLKNIERNKDGSYQWRIHLQSIDKHLPLLMDGFSDAALTATEPTVPTIFIRGEESGYVMDEDMLYARQLFPGAELITIPKAGHWLHAQQPELFAKTINYFLLD
jgi:pimeloyl-ACP methyl ester carboxylesterase